MFIWKKIIFNVKTRILQKFMKDGKKDLAGKQTN